MSPLRAARGLLLVAAVALSAAPSAFAFRAEGDPKRDARRFGLDKPDRPVKAQKRRYSPQAVVRLDQLRKAGAKVRYSPSGAVAAVTGPILARGGPPEPAARGFLRDYQDALGIAEGTLVLETSRATPVGAHLLFSQTHQGVPVEFARVKVTLGASGDVLALHSSYEPEIRQSPAPSVSREAAAQAAASDLGKPVEDPGKLVYLPVPKTGEVRLAWRFKAGGARAIWLYYVDASTGEVLLRYDELRHVTCNGGAGGTVQGMVYDVDPASTPIAARPMAHQKVWQYHTDITTYAVTEADGSYCNPTTPSKIFTALQGPHVTVAHFTKDSAHYDNGGGRWFIAATPVTSPSPYPNGSSFPVSKVFQGTINSAPPPGQFDPSLKAVKAIANFDFFQVGSQTSDGDIGDDDQVHIYDSEGNRVASYLGNRTPFHSAAVHGCLSCDQAANRPPMRIELWANQSGQQQGFRVNVSSYLILTDQPTQLGVSNHVLWTSTMTFDTTVDEINVFYHLNKMHDFFMGDVNRSTLTWISSAVVAMAHFGPNLGNAFFNPDHNNFGFGDLGGGIALDATVVRHEYVHFVVDKIFPTINFGQHGAISEGVADYFAASSLNYPSIGKFVGRTFGGESALRELACDPGGGSPVCRRHPGDWVGEIHDDSIPLGQALWELRSDLRAAFGNSDGQSCADGLVWQTLFFFPDSFQEFEDAMLLVDAAGTVARCGCTNGGCGAAANRARSTILNRLANHITHPSASFAYEPNDGTQTAVDITTLTSITASLYPAADIDYYAFSAGPGHVKATLQLPAASEVSYYAYGLTLVDSKLHAFQEAFPVPDVRSTFNGACTALDCQTSASTVVLEYENPSAGQFYLLVSGAPTDLGSNSGTYSSTPYVLTLQNPLTAALAGSVVDATVDNDRIDFTVRVSSFARQNYRFEYAQLRDHRFEPIPNTKTDAAGFLGLVGATVSADGKITGSVKLQAFGGNSFTTRYPSFGTVYLEVFALNELQYQTEQVLGPPTIGKSQSMGLSAPIHLAAPAPKLTAFNNVFRPEKGERATFKFETKEAGRVKLQLFTRSGALVATLYDDVAAPGKGSVDWNGRNLAGSTVASGIYLLKLSGPGGQVSVQKVVIVK